MADYRHQCPFCGANRPKSRQGDSWGYHLIHCATTSTKDRRKHKPVGAPTWNNHFYILATNCIPLAIKSKTTRGYDAVRTLNPDLSPKRLSPHVHPKHKCSLTAIKDDIGPGSLIFIPNRKQP